MAGTKLIVRRCLPLAHKEQASAKEVPSAPIQTPVVQEVDDATLPPPPAAPVETSKICRWTCHCGKVFPSSTRYRKHLQLHTAERSFRCQHPGCTKEFKRKTHLDRHVLQHQERRPHECPEPGCCKTFCSRQKLERHLRSHTGLSCNICGARFRKRAKLEEHKQGHERAKASKAMDGGGCSIAPLDAPPDDTAQRLGVPNETLPELQPTQELSCPQCGKAVRDTEALKRHLKLHKLRSQGHKCDNCASTFSLFRDLVAHRHEQHPKANLCVECGKAFAHASRLRVHQERVHSDAVQLCPYPHCGQTFTSKSNLRIHQRAAHLGQRPFCCKLCGMTFAYRHVLRRHCFLIHANAQWRSPPRDDAKAVLLSAEPRGMRRSLEGRVVHRQVRSAQASQDGRQSFRPSLPEQESLLQSLIQPLSRVAPPSP